MVVHTELTTKWVVFLIINFGERKVGIKYKVRDFDVLILNILLILSKNSL